MKKAKFWGAALVVMALFIRPEASVAGAQRAMRLWCGSVAPALFPFLALMPMLTGEEACRIYDAALSRVMKPLFGLSGATAPAVVVGLIAGSPGGALAARRVAARTGMKRCDAKRMALALSGVSPAYLVLGVGQGLYGSARLGMRLALIQLCVQLVLLCLLRGAFAGEEAVEPLPEALDGQNPIRAAVENVLAICGYMVLFGGISSAIASFAGEKAGFALLLATDLPSGLEALAHWRGTGRMMLQGAAIGFGGLCIAAQNVDALRAIGVRWRDYLGVRAIAAALSACTSGILLKACEAAGEISLGTAGQTYAFSLLMAGLAAVPGLVLLTKSLYLNNGRERAKSPQNRQKQLHLVER